jgi:hypothetical protein
VLRPDDLLAFQPHASAWGSKWNPHQPQADAWGFRPASLSGLKPTIRLDQKEIHYA